MDRGFYWKEWFTLLAGLIIAFVYGAQTNDAIGTFGVLLVACAIVGLMEKETWMAMSFFITLFGGGLMFSIGHKCGINMPALACLTYWAVLFIVAFKVMMAVFHSQRKQEENNSAQRHAKRSAPAA